MDQDQFGGRTDDDLFADDIEFVPYEEQVVVSQPTSTVEHQHHPPPAAEPTLPQSTPELPTPVSNAPTPAQPPPKSLAQSRHNRPPGNSNTHNNPNTNSSNNNNTNSSSNKTAKTHPDAASPAAHGEPSSNGPPPTAPKGPAAAAANAKSTASAISEARLGSGANPRTKLTEAELTARLEEMRIVNAAKTRRFEEAQRDAAEHAVAYAKGMEDARKRRAEDAAKRKAAEEEKKKLEDERAKNRDRKLKALGMTEGGWDEGKEERLREEQERVFKGAHGGVRGVKNYNGGGGLSGSRFASSVDDEYGGFGLRGRSAPPGQRGRGARRGGGRGGSRQLFDAGDDDSATKYEPLDPPRAPAQPSGSTSSGPSSTPLKPEDFPGLPNSNPAPKTTTSTWASVIKSSAPAAKMNWADEVNDQGN
ncbi:hypothetical protein QBC42DRAFT_41848 [Cladorrhinum samala]|uniref:Uncharacterized protein n=1 Tax=Cladorrhinum samala TaxID=585594 RepID=A0AAV9I1G6_9PEZI|nr:hypothetical protein QBC42DRAFT_41848 [Cladorrhinum samala]